MCDTVHRIFQTGWRFVDRSVLGGNMGASLRGITAVLSIITLVGVQGNCPASWCLNGGICEEDPPVCLCPDDFFGVYCERELTGDERCVASLCMNGGECPEILEDVACICPEGFMGLFCETEVCEVDADCNGGECLNESSSSSIGVPECIFCPDGLTGPRCQTPFGEFCGAVNGICLNGGSCQPRTEQTNGFACACRDNYVGAVCQVYDECSGINPCHNEAVCDGGTCQCEFPFHGVLCERVSACTNDQQCMNGGTCSAAGECICEDGYSGPRCGMARCNSNMDCLNGGRCNEDDTCECIANHEGGFCEIACTTDSQCQNGGQCEPSGTCECVNGFLGSRCQDSPENNVAIIAAVVAVVVILVLLIVIILLLVRRRLAMKRQRRTRVHGELELGNSNGRRGNTYIGINDKRGPPVASRPGGLIYEPGGKPQEFPRELLHVMEQLGAGSFATVHRAEADGIVKKGTMTTVAVKMLKTTATEGDKSDFEKERSMYLTLGSHPNVVKMLGYCTEKEPFYLIMEYLPNGNLQTYLRHIRTGSKEQYFDLKEEHREEKRNFLLPGEILSFALQIADGMEFLASKSCIHRDLATRNILLGDDLVAKVSDFGLARDIQDSSQYEMKSHGRVPVRWMAPESLLDNIYTSKSDVWGYAVLLWELVTLGSHPYPGMSSKKVIDEIVAGYRLPKPESCSDEIYDMMKSCWNKAPQDRPTFTEICKLLGNMMADASGYLVMADLNRDDYLYLEPNQTKSVNTADDY